MFTISKAKENTRTEKYLTLNNAKETLRTATKPNIFGMGLIFRENKTAWALGKLFIVSYRPKYYMKLNSEEFKMTDYFKMQNSNVMQQVVKQSCKTLSLQLSSFLLLIII